MPKIVTTQISDKEVVRMSKKFNAAFTGKATITIAGYQDAYEAVLNGQTVWFVIDENNITTMTTEQLVSHKAAMFNIASKSELIFNIF
jgi:TPP-dependent indolepyruvate ferredoxin oxidoreductase alpha subunit